MTRAPSDRPGKLTPARRALLEAEIREGFRPQAEIAAAFGIAQATVSRAARAIGRGRGAAGASVAVRLSAAEMGLLDALAETQGYATRSEVFRQLLRAASGLLAPDPGLAARLGEIAGRLRGVATNIDQMARKANREQLHWSAAEARDMAALAGRREAMVKIIPKGGCHGARRLARQLGYLGRAGEVAIHGAAAFGLDTPLKAAELSGIMAGWTAGWRGSPKHGHSLHMILSFPAGTDPEAAFEAGRDFAETTFGSGDYGDARDYLVAAHMDRAHPHVHLIVNRHGLEHGRLLSTGKTAPLNPDHLRMLQVEAAARHGIAMTATARLARGLRDLAPGVTAWRRAFEAGEEALDRSRSGAALAYAEAAIAHHARAWRQLGKVFAGLGREELAQLLAQAADILTEGGEIMAEPHAVKPEDSASLAAARGRIAAALDRAETQLRRTGDPRERAVKERALGILKGRAASFLPERADLAAHRKDPPVELYHAPALQALREAPEGPAALTQARERVAAAAKAVGIDPAAFLARHEAGGPLDAGTAAAWLAEELVSVMKARGLDPERAGTADRRSAAEAIDRLHGFAETRFHEVARAIGLGADRAAPAPAAAVANRPEDPQAAELNLLHRQARNAIEKSRTRPASPAEREAQIRFAAVVEARLSKADLDRLQQGDARAIAALAPTRLARATLALTWAEARHALADAPTRARLERPLREAIREHAIAKALEAQAREKSLGKDREREK